MASSEGSRSRPRQGAAPDGGDNLPPRLYSDDDLSRLCDVYVLLVWTPAETPRRRLYLTLAGAQQALHRALERGGPAQLVLRKLVPPRQLELTADGSSDDVAGENL